MNELNPKELKTYMGETNDPPILIDVREQWEYDIVHFPDSELIPMSELSEQLGKLNQDSEIVVICHHGIRSRAAGIYLEKHGFKKVINLKGGIDAWARDIDPSMPTYE